VRAQALDTADLVQGALDSIADVDATLTQAEADHASIGQPSGLATLGADGILTPTQRPPSITSLSSLTDVDTTGIADRATLQYVSSSSKWAIEKKTVLYAVHKFTDPATHVDPNAYQGWGVTNAVEFATKLDPAGIMNASTYIVTIPAAGLYSIHGMLSMANTAVTPQAFLMSNGSLGTNFILKVGNGSGWTVVFDAVLQFAAADQFSLGVWQNYSGGGIRDLAYASLCIDQLL
jgi:hypothetical protein